MATHQYRSFVEPILTKTRHLLYKRKRRANAIRTILCTNKKAASAFARGITFCYLR